MCEPGISIGQPNLKIDKEVAPHSLDTVNYLSLLLCFIKTISMVHTERVRARTRIILNFHIPLLTYF